MFGWANERATRQQAKFMMSPDGLASQRYPEWVRQRQEAEKEELRKYEHQKFLDETIEMPWGIRVKP